MFITIYRRGTSPKQVYVPRQRVVEVIEEYRILGWDVAW